MLGQHEGISALVDRDAAAGAALRALGRLKAGGDVPKRKKMLATAFRDIDAQDRYWLEAMVAGLTDAGLEAIPAHLAALAAGWEVAETEIAAHIREVNNPDLDDFAQRAVLGVRAASPEFGRRMETGKINSDEVFLRVALAHLFRRDPDSQVQMFIIDGLARGLVKALKLDVQDFTARCLEHTENVPPPENAWGYLLLLRELSGRSGFFLTEPTEESRANLVQIERALCAEIGDPGDRFINHIGAAAYSGFLMQGNQGTFGSLMAAALERENMRFAILYVREDEDKPAGEGGVHTQILKIPAETVVEARDLVLKLPEVRMHDDFRRFTEQLAQIADSETAPGRV